MSEINKNKAFMFHFVDEAAKAEFNFPIYPVFYTIGLDTTLYTRGENNSNIPVGNSLGETTSSIQAKRPLKTVNNTSLEGTGNIEIVGGVETVNTLTGDVVLTAENVDTTATSGKTIKAEIDENPTATQAGRIKADLDTNSGGLVLSIDGTDIT